MQFSRYFLLCLPILCFSVSSGQQISDDSYRYENLNPVFETGTGPQVCIDEGHFNFHTADGNYKPFADLLRTDGYVVAGYSDNFSNLKDSNCNLLVIANAISEYNSQDWDLPHYSAFTREEIADLVAWIVNGGNLFFISDHSPMAGAATDLAAVLGIMIANAYALVDGFGTATFTISSGNLLPHPITQGRSISESVDSITTFQGLAALFGEMWDPIISFGDGDTAYIRSQHTNLSEDIGGLTEFSIAGWSQIATRSLGEGKIVFQGEAAMCTAQTQVRLNNKFGINSELAPQNAMYCLNTVRWLTGVLD